MTDEITPDDARKAKLQANAAKARAKAKANREAKLAQQAEPISESLAALDRKFGGLDEAREALAAAARTPTRSGARTLPDGRVEVIGHNGERLSRVRTQVGDIFEIPQSMIPKGWSMQWNAISVAGNSEILLDQNHMMYQNGWRPVPAERYAGSLVPKGSKGNIIRGQQMLMERPLELTIEARAEEERNARQLISDRNENLKLAGMKKQMPEGFESKGGGVRVQLDKSLDVLNVHQQAGQYTLDE